MISLLLNSKGTAVISRFRALARDAVPKLDSEMKVIGWLGAAASIGFGLAAWLIGDTPSASSPSGCEALANEVANAQSAYHAQIEPIRARWTEITRDLERADLLPSERRNKIETEKLTRGELDKLRSEQRSIIEKITNSCER